MKVKMSYNVCFRRVLFFMALMGICQMAYGTLELRFYSVVTNVPDANHVLVDGRRMKSGDIEVVVDFGPVPLFGIAAPENGSPEEEALLDILEKTLLGKRIYGIEIIDGESRGASIYVTDDPGRRMPEDNVNLMLVREGYARFSRALNGMAEAQRLAQEERKGIWATFEASPPPEDRRPVPAPPEAKGEIPVPPSEPDPEPSPPPSVITPEAPPPVIASVSAKQPSTRIYLYAIPLLLLAVTTALYLRRKK